MTHFEYVKILGMRTTAIAVGCDPLIPVDGSDSASTIARKEILQGKCDLVVCRELPDGSYDEIPCSEMILPRDI
ncbi:MAG TPA: hypothetical protein VLE02_01930 [Nitrosarchaeum sp.]|nr:hypothetical protein [Nitrosarchaeum sp.]